MAQLMSLAELIDAAISSEVAARKVYLGFTHKFFSRPDVADFWQSMADDEGDHARILSDLHIHIFEEDLRMPIDARLAEQARELNKLDVRQLVNSIQNLDEAYEIAYKLESSEVNTLFNFLTIRCLPIEESYEIISATMDRHLLRLARFTRTFGDAEQCRHIAVSA